MKMNATNAAMVITGAAILITGQPATATGTFTTQTGKPCAACHQNPGTDMKLTPLGQAFVANGYKLPRDTATPPEANPPAKDSTPPK
jgi:hypothetical protein